MDDGWWLLRAVFCSFWPFQIISEAADYILLANQLFQPAEPGAELPLSAYVGRSKAIKEDKEKSCFALKIDIFSFSLVLGGKYADQIWI